MRPRRPHRVTDVRRGGGPTGADEIFNQFDVPVNMERVLHRDQKLIFHRPIVAGDKLWFDSYLDSVIESHGAILTEVRGEVTDDDGNPVLPAS